MDEPSDDAACPFDSFEDKLLMHVFTYLSIVERIRVERVSKRWMELSYKVDWILTVHSLRGRFKNNQPTRINLYCFLFWRDLVKRNKQVISLFDCIVLQSWSSSTRLRITSEQLSVNGRIRPLQTSWLCRYVSFSNRLRATSCLLATMVDVFQSATPMWTLRAFTGSECHTPSAGWHHFACHSNQLSIFDFC